MLFDLLRKVLVLAPHTDDAELGCGATIRRLLDKNVGVTVAAFSTAEESLPPNAARSCLRDEFLNSMKCLGVPDQQVIAYGYPVRRLPYHRQELLEEIVKLGQRVQPEMVLLPSASDLHQDHQTIYAEGLRAFKDRTVWGYELPWNHIEFAAQAFVTVSRSHLEAKWGALKAYRSQFELKRPYFSWEFVEGLARVRGLQVKEEYAEAFEVLRFKW